jgi:hypothetical protein
VEGLWIKQAPLELFLADGTASLIWNGVFKFRFRICGIASLDGFLNYHVPVRTTSIGGIVARHGADGLG